MNERPRNNWIKDGVEVGFEVITKSGLLQEAKEREG